MIGIRLRGLLAVIAGLAALGGGLARAQSAVPESQLETFLGLQQGDLTGLNNGPVMNGSAIEQTITVPAGATLSFNYDFLDERAGDVSAGRGQPVRIRDEPEPGRFRGHVLAASLFPATDPIRALDGVRLIFRDVRDGWHLLPGHWRCECDGQHV